MEEHSKHLRLLTLLNEDFVKMITASNEDLAGNEEKAVNISQPKDQPSQNKSKETALKKFKKLAKKHGLSSSEKVNPTSSLSVAFENGVNAFKKRQDGSDKVLKKRTKETTVVSVSSSEKVEETADSRRKNERERKNYFDRELWWYEPPEESLPLDFCRDTSLHGLKYIGQSKRHLTERVFWFVAFVSGLCLAFYLISDVWIKYNLSPIIVSFRPVETSVDQIPFPAVTICNMNKVLKSKADEYLGPLGNPEDAYYVRHVCSTTKSFSKRFNYTDEEESTKVHMEFDTETTQTEENKGWTRVNEFLRKAAQNCTDMIPLCMWQDTIIENCSSLFRPIETEYGKCCVFNMIPLSLLYSLRNDERDNEKEINQWEQWDIDSDGFLLEQNYTYDFPRHQMQAGKSFGLSFVLNPALEEYFCTSSDSEGFRMSTHLSIDSNRVTDFGISIRPNAEVFVNVKPEITLVDSTVFKFPIETRNCYRHEEFSLKYYKYYTSSNCIDECIANETLKRCGCKRYYMPRDETESLCGANFTGFSCAEEVKYSMSKMGSKNSCKMCLASCNGIQYHSQTTTTPLKPNIWINSLDETSSLASQNVSIVHVFFGQDAVYPRVRKELFGSTDLFASTGGLMGLCLGFSGLSLMEVLYFLTLRAWWCYKRKQNETNPQEKSLGSLDEKLSNSESSNYSSSSIIPLQMQSLKERRGRKDGESTDCDGMKVTAITKKVKLTDECLLPKAIKAADERELPEVAIDDGKVFNIVGLPPSRNLNVESLRSPKKPKSYKSILGEI